MYDRTSPVTGCQLDPEDARPRMSELDLTLEQIGYGTRFREELEANFEQREGELISFEQVNGLGRDRDGFASSAIYELTSACRIYLDQDDTLADVRRKIAAELRMQAERVEGGA